MLAIFDFGNTDGFIEVVVWEFGVQDITPVLFEKNRFASTHNTGTAVEKEKFQVSVLLRVSE